MWPGLLSCTSRTTRTEPHLCVPTVKKLTYLAVVGAGPVLLGIEGPAGGVAWWCILGTAQN